MGKYTIGEQWGEYLTLFGIVVMAKYGNSFSFHYESLTKLRLILQTRICQKKFSVTNFICLFFSRSVSTVQPLQKLLTLLTMGLKISRDADFEYIRKFFIRLSKLPVTYSN
jgi:hypothetical protein